MLKVGVTLTCTTDFCAVSCRIFCSFYKHSSFKKPHKGVVKMHNVNLKCSYIDVSSGGEKRDRVFANLTLSSCLYVLSCGCFLAGFFVWFQVGSLGFSGFGFFSCVFLFAFYFSSVPLFLCFLTSDLAEENQILL